MHPFDDLGLRQQQNLERAFQIFAAPVAEAVASVIGFAQAEPLQSRAHRAVENDDAFVQQFLEWMELLRHEPH